MTELAERFEFVVRWEPFLLRPNTPVEGTPKPAMFSDPTNERVQHLKQSGSDVGCHFSFKSKLIPNTLKGHALMEYAKTKDGGTKQNDIAEELFKAYFSDGKMLDESTILEAAQLSTFDMNEVKSYINDDSVIQNIKERALSWNNKGVTGVPFFYINGQAMFSGAQESEVFKRMFISAATKYPSSRS